MSHLKLALVLVVAALSAGCGWEQTMAFRSRSGHSAVEIWQTRIDNSWGTRVELLAATQRKVLLENRREAHVYFVHVYWSRDESKVAILLTGGNIWELACEVPSGRTISFDDLREDLALSIQETYHLPPGQDPSGWARMSEGQAAFFNLHPEIRVSYH